MYGRAAKKVIEIIEDKTDLMFGFYVVRFDAGIDGEFNAVFDWSFNSEGKDDCEWNYDWYEGQKDIWITAIWNVEDLDPNDDNLPFFNTWGLQLDTYKI